jgi:hypothetical protein
MSPSSRSCLRRLAPANRRAEDGTAVAHSRQTIGHEQRFYQHRHSVSGVTLHDHRYTMPPMTSLQRPQAPDPYDLLPEVAAMDLSSDDVAHGAAMPAEFVSDGGNQSPQLSWSNAPNGSQSYVVS